MLGTFPEVGNLSLVEKFQMLKDAGFEGVEVNVRDDRKEVLKARDQTGLSVAGISCGACTRPFASADSAERQKGVEGLFQALRDASKFGAKSVLVVAGGVTDQVSYAQNDQRTREEIRKAIPLAEELGIVLAVENVWNHFLLSPLEAARYVDEFNSPAVGWHFDVGNVMSIGWPEHWISVLGKRIEKIHIKEFSRKKMGQEGLRKGFAVEFFEGDNDWPAITRALDEVGYKGWCIVEDACDRCKKTFRRKSFCGKFLIN